MIHQRLLLVSLMVLAIVSLTGLLRADQTTKTLIAQDHLRQLGHAMTYYLSNNNYRLDDSTRLWEQGGFTDPTVFWHPGDSDPSPKTINNSVPNAPNSTQISFTIPTGNLDLLNDQPLVWDNTPANNGGGFISYVSLDGVIETDPPNVSPVPTSVAITHAHMERLWFAIAIYANTGNGTLPINLSEVFPLGYYGPRNFWNPGDSDPMPLDILSDEPNGLDSALVSFDFPAAGMLWDDLPPYTPILIDNSAANNGGFGVNVLYRYGGARFLTSGTFGDANEDGNSDLKDWAVLQRCRTSWPYDAILENVCRLLDWDGDDRIEVWDDHEHFVLIMIGPRP